MGGGLPQMQPPGQQMGGMQPAGGGGSLGAILQALMGQGGGQPGIVGGGSRPPGNYDGDVVGYAGRVLNAPPNYTQPGFPSRQPQNPLALMRMLHAVHAMAAPRPVGMGMPMARPQNPMPQMRQFRPPGGAPARGPRGF
jgi:hypothetical protein